WWPADSRPFVLSGLRRANGPRALEIWCSVPLETARRRYEARHPRHPVHGDLPTDDEWERWRRAAQPLGVGPTLRVATIGPVEIETVVAWLGRPGVVPAGASRVEREAGSGWRPGRTVSEDG